MNKTRNSKTIIQSTSYFLLVLLFLLILFLSGCLVTSETSNKIADNSKHNYTICWLGDSLTQGSLGLDGDNIENAPYLRLSEITGNNVEGYGYYGYNTHDVFWVYSDEDHENQRKDSSKVYVFWVGANDFASCETISTDAAPVIDEINSFITAGNIDKYIVLGCNPRIELRSSGANEDPYEVIDRQFEKAFGDRFMGISELISIENGYCIDNIHLTQESYDIIAKAVANKLRELDFL